MSRKKDKITHRQWIGIAILIIVIVAVEVFIHCVPQQPIVVPTDDIDSLLVDSIRRKQSIRYHYDTIEIHLQRFDPNTADSLTLLHLGLRSWQVKNMLRYRQKGGYYRKAEDMKRLYGMTDSLYAVLEPYIDIAPLVEDTTTKTDSVLHYQHVKRDTILELNSTDTAELQLLRGVGRYTAVQIIRYRQELGGYVTPEQIREIDNLTLSLDSVIRHLIANPDSVRKISVNRTGAEKLSRHPYLRFSQAKAIYELRRRRVRLNEIEELADLPEFNNTDIERLRPYLSFE